MLPVHAKFVHLPHRSERKPTNIWSVRLTQISSVSSTFRRPGDAAQLRRKLGWIFWIKQLLVQWFAGLQFLFRRADDEPKDFGVCIIKNLAQQFGTDKD